MENLRWIIFYDLPCRFHVHACYSQYIIIGYDKNAVKYAIKRNYDYQGEDSVSDPWQLPDKEWNEINAWMPLNLDPANLKRDEYNDIFRILDIGNYERDDIISQIEEDDEIDTYAIFESLLQIRCESFKKIRFRNFTIPILRALKTYKNDIDPKIAKILANHFNTYEYSKMDNI